MLIAHLECDVEKNRRLFKGTLFASMFSLGFRQSHSLSCLIPGIIYSFTIAKLLHKVKIPGEKPKKKFVGLAGAFATGMIASNILIKYSPRFHKIITTCIFGYRCYAVVLLPFVELMTPQKIRFSDADSLYA